ncbi:cystathionine beta-lyase [Pandoraea sputorum]|uniref:cystathionine beta-lyase n=1 Tax=Pandoraea sputorum TaxID=93222 RepID=UPI00125C05E2|nr:cystathionine beta-lyase [Pandoraea sputorum]VVE81658.1 cystathionine beta-lyase [Pandoraea sputorum]
MKDKLTATRVDWRTQLVDATPMAPGGFRSLNTPVERGSTTLFDSAAQVRDVWDPAVAAYTYGLYGTPTTYELAERIARLEGAKQTFITPGGQAAIALVYLSLCRPGDHVLVPESAYGPNRAMAQGILSRLGVRVDMYDPMIGAGIVDMLKPETRLVWCESPGSITMEVQDVAAIVAAVHRHGAYVALDNTYAAGVLYDAFSHGVDVSIQALTKYIGGHSDVLLGSVSVRDETLRERIGDTRAQLGMAVSPDECSLALRGLQTLGVRLDALGRSSTRVAEWLAARPEIEQVLHPALSGSPGHAFWKRDFNGAASVFSIVFKPAYSREAVLAFVDALKLFRIGYSWGGVTSLAVPCFDLNRQYRDYDSRIVRLNVGLESPEDLIDDLSQALDVLS